MKFYTNSHKFYCGADLHTKTIYLCVLDQDGNILTHRNISAKPEPFLHWASAPSCTPTPVCQPDPIPADFELTSKSG